MSHILLRHRDIPDLDQLEVYLKHGGFQAFKKALSMEPDAIKTEVFNAGLRGRGGAGFPTGLKWRFIDNNAWPHYVVANADESEPGTFKDREIMEGNPYQFFEGMMICALAVNAEVIYNYMRGEFWELGLVLDEKVAALEQAGYLGDDILGSGKSMRLFNHLGAGAYICGEETALLESLEGKLGQPRLRPPFPPSFGVYGKPTIVNNVETFANVPPILEHGADWYRQTGTEKSPGPKIFSLSGNVDKPGNYELPLGTTFRELIFEHGGGIPDGKSIKAIMPAGASSAIIVADDKALDTPMDYEHVPEVGSMLGSASIIVIDDSVNMDWLVRKTLHFFKHESCGKCTPCREGTFWMTHLIDRIHEGDQPYSQVELMVDVAKNIEGKCLCALGEFSIQAVITGVERFGDDFIQVTSGSASSALAEPELVASTASESNEL
jgi:NADH-quinone oxidoreductase subunit F